MNVKKNDGSIEAFDREKIIISIEKAYDNVKEPYSDIIGNSICDNLYLYDNITTNEIRRQIEEALMTVNKHAAKEYIEKYDANKELFKKQDFINNYIKASNAAEGSIFDANANVSNKNIVTLEQELYKENNIKQNRYIMQNKIKKLYSKKLADQYVKDIESHVMYKHDETSLKPYCVAISMYPFLTDGLKSLGGVSNPPTDLKSFCGGFVNLIYSISSQFAGATASPELLMYMDYFIRKDYGDDYIEHLDEVVDLSAKKRTLRDVIDNCFQQIVYSINMPAGNRG